MIRAAIRAACSRSGINGDIDPIDGARRHSYGIIRHRTTVYASRPVLIDAGQCYSSCSSGESKAAYIICGGCPDAAITHAYVRTYTCGSDPRQRNNPMFPACH